MPQAARMQRAMTPAERIAAGARIPIHINTTPDLVVVAITSTVAATNNT